MAEPLTWLCGSIATAALGVALWSLRVARAAQRLSEADE